jgi:chitinase
MRAITAKGSICGRSVTLALLLGVVQVLVSGGLAFAAPLDPSSSYFVAVTSYATNGLESIDFNLVGNDEPDPATVVLPANDSASLGAAAIRVTAPADLSLAKVQLLVNGTPSAELAATPYQFAWDTSLLAPGDYAVSVRASDAAGHVLDSEQVIVSLTGNTTTPAPAVDTTAPAAFIATPVGGSILNGSAAVSVAASDNVAVTRVELYLDNALLATVTAAPYSFSWNTAKVANGNYTLLAKAYDAAGNSTQSSPVALQVFNDLSSPSIALLSPAPGSTVGGVLPVNVAASDDVAVTKVEFYLNGQLHSALATAPYTFNWNTTLLANGPYTLSALAYDGSGNLGRSAEFKVTVFNDSTVPVVSIDPVGSATPAGSVTLTGLVRDNDAVGSVTVQLGSGLAQPATVSGGTWSLTVSGLSAGTIPITVVATDRSGNSARASSSLVVTAASAPVEGPLTLNDAWQALQVASSNQHSTAEQLARYDVGPFVNGASQPDGVINTLDVVVILLKLVGKL